MLQPDPNPRYQFSFDIKDDESTNYHNRKETRDGDKISGSYSVVDSDGYIRTVTYTADPKEVSALTLLFRLSFTYSEGKVCWLLSVVTSTAS